jgi:hypothetical protein
MQRAWQKKEFYRYGNYEHGKLWIICGFSALLDDIYHKLHFDSGTNDSLENGFRHRAAVLQHIQFSMRRAPCKRK